MLEKMLGGAFTLLFLLFWVIGVFWLITTFPMATVISLVIVFWVAFFISIRFWNK